MILWDLLTLPPSYTHAAGCDLISYYEIQPSCEILSFSSLRHPPCWPFHLMAASMWTSTFLMEQISREEHQLSDSKRGGKQTKNQAIACSSKKSARVVLLNQLASGHNSMFLSRPLCKSAFFVWSRFGLATFLPGHPLQMAFFVLRFLVLNPTIAGWPGGGIICIFSTSTKGCGYLPHPGPYNATFLSSCLNISGKKCMILYVKTPAHFQRLRR